ncbi:MAG: hypothetical protein I3273_04655 [Candidatus Moeniiplasma glomeromycotorum]|nr:hypothetical protein [Candidatus Moeniiplasma glomeromycotorum]MCE8169384.1 hypothetical protein [Candidatus Moeniiplasma glomeromycotorum]
MNSKNISFRLATSVIMPEEWTENDKKYLLFEFLHSEFHVFVSDKAQGILLVPDDNNSAIINQIKNNLEHDTFYTTPLTNLKFKPDFIDIWKGKSNNPFYYHGWLVKDISQLEKLTEPSVPLPEITFKVRNQQKKGYAHGADGKLLSYEESFRQLGSYIHELEIEPLDLGIEGMPPITHLNFEFADPLPSRRVLFKPLTKSPLYNSNILTESVGKEFNMKIKSFSFSQSGSTLRFSSDLSFEWDSFQEKKIGDNSNNPPFYNALKEKILRNLDKICLDPIGYLANAELMKNQIFSGWHETKEMREKGFFKIKDENGEEINLEEIFNWPNWESSRKNYREIGKAIVAKIKNNSTDWEIIKESGWKLVRNKKTGLKHYQPFFLTTPSFLTKEKKEI